MQTITTPAGIYTPPATALIQKVQLRIFESCPSATLCLMQYDRALPVISVELFEGGNPYKVPENAAVNIRMVKPDKTTVYNPALGVSSDRKTTYIGITPQMTACFGSCAATLEIALNDGVLGTGLLRLNIEKNPVSEDAVESSDEYLSLQEIVNKVQTYADQASTAAKSAEATAELAMNSVQAAVSVNAQTFTEEQKAQARANIGAASTMDTYGTVKYTEQKLTGEQKLQALANIQAVSYRPGQDLGANGRTAARQNIDAAQKNHASMTMDYGVADSLNFGHVRLHTAVSDRDAPGTAVTPRAVYDAINRMAVTLGAQELTEEQQTQVRANIGALSRDEIVELIESMPKQDSVLHMDAALLNAGGAYPADSIGYAAAVIPAGATYIDLDAFAGLPFLQELTLNGNCEMETAAVRDSYGKTAYYYNALGNSGAPIRRLEIIGRATVDAHFARNIATLRELHLGAGVKTIGTNAFSYTGLDTVSMEEVTSVGQYAFAGNPRLKSIVICDGATELVSGAFHSCTNLESVTLPETITTIGNSCFSLCKKLASIVIPNSVTSIGSSPFEKTTVIKGRAGSYAESWAAENGYTFEVIA